MKFKKNDIVKIIKPSKRSEVFDDFLGKIVFKYERDLYQVGFKIGKWTHMFYGNEFKLATRQERFLYKMFGSRVLLNG